MDQYRDIEHLIASKPWVKAIIFDFDGVLVRLGTDYDSMRKELSELFDQKYGFSSSFQPLHEALYTIEEVYGPRAWSAAREIILKHEILGLKNAAVNVTLLKTISVIGGKRKLAVFSSNLHETIHSFLVERGMDDLFEVIVSRECVRRIKPDPEGILLILRRFQVSQEETIFIGDRDVDLQAGYSAGVPTYIIGNW